MDTPTKRVGIWIRVSTEDQAKGELKRGRIYFPQVSASSQ